MDEIKRLKEIGANIKKYDYGLIFRTNAAGVEEKLLADEYNLLIDIFKKIERERNFLPCPKLIYKEIDFAHQIIRDVYNERIDRIILNNKKNMKAL